MKVKLLLFFTALLLIACKNDASKTVNVEESQDNNELKADSIAPEPEKFSIDSSKIMEEKVEEQKVIEQKFGVQLDFCTCIKTIDSIAKAFENPELSDDNMDILDKRSDYIENKCKAITTTPNTTDEERSKHRKKVKDCLNN